MPEARAVQAMFARIARRYDFLNRVLSAGIDRRWRARLVRRLAARVESGVARQSARSGCRESDGGTAEAAFLAAEHGPTSSTTQHEGARSRSSHFHHGLLAPLVGREVLDVACGTGDLAFELAEAGARVVGLDFTREMLVLARAKDRAGRVPFLNGDALALPFERASFDAATIAFGLRNLEDRRRGLAELARVVRPGGTVMVLEFSLPRARLLAAPYRFYFTRVLPRVGALVSGDGEAYRYLPETVLAWPKPEELQREMEGVGLAHCGFELLSGGIACLSFGEVAPSAAR